MVAQLHTEWLLLLNIKGRNLGSICTTIRLGKVFLLKTYLRITPYWVRREKKTNKRGAGQSKGKLNGGNKRATRRIVIL